MNGYAAQPYDIVNQQHLRFYYKAGAFRIRFGIAIIEIDPVARVISASG